MLEQGEEETRAELRATTPTAETARPHLGTSTVRRSRDATKVPDPVISFLTVAENTNEAFSHSNRLYNTAKHYGEDLYGSTLSESLRAQLEWALTDQKQTQRVVRLRLCAKPPFDLLRWEALHTGTDFICLDPGMSRTLPERIGKLHDPIARLSVLLVASDSQGDLPLVDEEARAAERALEEAGVDSIVVLRGDEATKQNVLRRIKDGGHTVLHFAGHSHYLADTPDESYLQLSGQQLFAHELARAAARSHLQLVFLNSCSSAEMGESLSAGLGLAQSMAHEGVPYVIGMSCSVTDEGAFVLAKEFYSKLSDGEDPSVALALARQRVGVDLTWEDQTWLAPVLFS